MISKKEKDLLMAELHKLTPNAQDAAKMILEEFEQNLLELKNLRSMFTLATIQNDLPNEIWRDIKDYEGLYQVSNMGRVKSFHNGKELVMKITFDRCGYAHVVLVKNGVRKTHRVHILVAKAFIENTENKPEVNHKDGNKWNCRVDNLEWVTKSENQQHAVKTGLQKSGVDSPKAKFTEDQVREIRRICILDDKEFGINALARKYDVRKSVIGNIVHGKTYKNVK